jgi:hypothetical protein
MIRIDGIPAVAARLTAAQKTRTWLKALRLRARGLVALDEWIPLGYSCILEARCRTVITL